VRDKIVMKEASVVNTSNYYLFSKLDLRNVCDVQSSIYVSLKDDIDGLTEKIRDGISKHGCHVVHKEELEIFWSSPQFRTGYLSMPNSRKI